jgi:hypothetical protein
LRAAWFLFPTASKVNKGEGGITGHWLPQIKIRSPSGLIEIVLSWFGFPADDSHRKGKRKKRPIFVKTSGYWVSALSLPLSLCSTGDSEVETAIQ